VNGRITPRLQILSPGSDTAGLPFLPSKAVNKRFTRGFLRVDDTVTKAGKKLVFSLKNVFFV
jgi:hypothetical protein